MRETNLPAVRPPPTVERLPPQEIGEGPHRWAVVASDGREFLIRAARAKWSGTGVTFYPHGPLVLDLDEQVVAMFSRPISVVKVP